MLPGPAWPILHAASKEVCRALDEWLGLGLDELHDGLLAGRPRRDRVRGGQARAAPATQGQLAPCSRWISSCWSPPATVTSANTRTRCSASSGLTRARSTSAAMRPRG